MSPKIVLVHIHIPFYMCELCHEDIYLIFYYDFPIGIVPFQNEYFIQKLWQHTSHTLILNITTFSVDFIKNFQQ